jgi:hypothetical protein
LREDAALHLGLVEGRHDGPVRHVHDEGGVVPKHGGVLGALVVECLHGFRQVLAFIRIEGDVALGNPLFCVGRQLDVVRRLLGGLQMIGK